MGLTRFMGRRAFTGTPLGGKAPGPMAAAQTVTALIVAAGKGARLGGDVPKQYRAIAGKPMLRWAVEALVRHPRVDAIRVVIGEGQHDAFEAALAGLDVGPPIAGGASAPEFGAPRAGARDRRRS